jgi:hypothetical protein
MNLVGELIMQLVMRRSQKTTGMISKSVSFVLDARVDLSPEEAAAVKKYALGSQVLYNSANSKHYLEKAQSSGFLGAVASVAMAKMSLNISIDKHAGNTSSAKTWMNCWVPKKPSTTHVNPFAVTSMWPKPLMAGSWSLTSKKWQLPKPSVFTPFLRRFTDERALDIAETRELYRSVDARHKATVWSGQNAIQHLTETILESLAVDVPYDLRRNAYGLVKSLLELETTIFKSADDPDIGALSLKELVDLRRFLRAQEHFLDHEEEAIDLLVAYIQGIVEGTIKELPKLDAPSPFTVP